MDSIIQIGDRAPDFERESLDGRRVRLSEQRGRIVVLNFWSAECKWSERADRVLTNAMDAWGDRVAVWSIIANPNEPQALISMVVAQRELPTVLLDESQELTEKYGAVATPHFFVIDREGVLQYKGALDDATFRMKTPSKSYLLDAIDAMLEGSVPDPQETPGYGCAITKLYPESS